MRFQSPLIAGVLLWAATTVYVLGDPVTFAKEIEPIGEPLVRKVMGDNLARLMNVKNVPMAKA